MLICGQVHSYSITFTSSHVLRLETPPPLAAPQRSQTKINRAAASK